MQEGNTHMKTKTHAVLLALAACLCAGGAGAVATVPAGAPDHGARTFWDAAAWTQPPRTFPVEVPCSNEYGRVAGVEPVWIEGEPWRGRPTRVFAWWGLPRGASAQRKVPAMVLVHGGGGTAFARWVKTWNDRGYAAIAMDTCGKIPQGERDGRPHPAHAWSGPSGWGSSISRYSPPFQRECRSPFWRALPQAALSSPRTWAAAGN